MAKPSIGAAISPVQDAVIMHVAKELEILEDGSKESIFHLVFEDEDDNAGEQNEQKSKVQQQ